MFLYESVFSPHGFFMRYYLLQESSVASLESSIRWADGFLLLYSITHRLSFLEVPQLKKLIDQTKQSLGRELIHPLSRTVFFCKFTSRCSQIKSCT